MRTAALKDAWRSALRHQKGLFKLEKLTLRNVKGIGDKEIFFPSRFMALCGENGVGKTTFLKALYYALVPKNAASSGVLLRPQNSANPVVASCSINAKVKDEADGKPRPRVLDLPAEVSAFLEDDSEESYVTYIDAAATAQRLIHLINNDSEFSTALEGLAPADDAEEIRFLRSEITGREYSRVSTFEIEDYADLSVFPYFKVTVGGTTYCSEEMGLGELCANYLVWALGRMRNDSLLLLEEPESHLPPRAQDRLMGHVAYLASERNISVVVSTHSQHTLENLPSSHLVFLGRLKDQCIIQNNPRMSTLYDSLRIAKPHICIVVLEDHSAFAFLHTIVSEVDQALLSRIDFVWKAGWTDIDDVLTKFPLRRPGRVGLLGMYDGDQLGQSRPNFQWPYLYLPGNGDPAEYMRDSVF